MISFLGSFLLKGQKQKKKTKRKRQVYLLLVTLWLFYAPVNLTILSLITLIKNITFRRNCQQI
jgi:hypothetical protein